MLAEWFLRCRLSVSAALYALPQSRHTNLDGLADILCCLYSKIGWWSDPVGIWGRRGGSILLQVQQKPVKLPAGGDYLTPVTACSCRPKTDVQIVS